MTEIQIAVINKIPSVIGDIKCMISDNTDYTARFSFDDQWDEGTKNVFFVLDDGYAFPVVRMEGDVVEIPRVQKGGISRVLYIGVTQGDIRTTSGIGIRVKESITDMISDEAVQPDPSMWDDILARLIAVEEGIDDTVRDTVEEYLRENPVETVPEIFWVQYEKTTYEEVAAAVSAGMLCMMNVSGLNYQLTNPAGTGSPYDFYAIGRTRSLNWLRLWTDSTWTATNTQIITEQQKAGTITESTTGSNVPSVEAVRKYVRDMVPESVPPGNLAIVVMGESLDNLAVVSVQYPADAPEGYQPEDSIAAGNVTVMLALVDQNGDIAAMSTCVPDEVGGGAILTHMNLVQEDAVTSLVLEADLVSMTARALVYTEFAGGGTDSGASGWVEILPETEGVNDDPDGVMIEIPAVLNVSPGDKCRVYWQGNNLTAEAEVTAVSGDFYGYPAVILADYTGDEFTAENVQTFVLWYIPSKGGLAAADKANSTRCTVRIEKLVGENVTRAEFDALAETVSQHSEAIDDKLDANKLPEAINTALAQAKASGEFDGEDGSNYVLTEADKTEIAEIAAGLVDVPGGGGSDVELVAMIEGDGECAVIEKTADVSEDGVYMLSLKFDANLETNGTTNHIGVYVGAANMYTAMMTVIQDANVSNSVARRGGVTFVIKDKRGYVAGSANYSMSGIANACEVSKELPSNGKKLIVQSNSGATVPVGVRVYLFKLKFYLS